MNREALAAIALQDRFDAAYRDAKAPDAGLLDSSEAFAVMCETYLKMRHKKGRTDAHEA
jgi:hypothetical protein